MRVPQQLRILLAMSDIFTEGFGGCDVANLQEGFVEDPCNSTVLRKAARRVSQLYDSVLAPTGLRSTQRAILRNIGRFGAPSLGQLAASLVLDRSALGHNLKPLERDGLIVLEADPRDKRTRLAKLTSRGEGKLQECSALWEVAQERFETAVGPEWAKELRRALAIVAATEF